MARRYAQTLRGERSSRAGQCLVKLCFRPFASVSGDVLIAVFLGASGCWSRPTRVSGVRPGPEQCPLRTSLASAVVRRQVRAEGVVAEVGRRITPHRMGVVGLALGVVVLDEQPRALQPVVMRLAGAGGPGPGQVDGVQRGLVGVVRLRRQAVRDAPQVGGQQRAQQVPLPGVEFPGRQALRDAGQRESAGSRRRRSRRPARRRRPSGSPGRRACGSVNGPRHTSRRYIIWSPSASRDPVAADDVRRRPVEQDRAGGPLGVERADELTGQVLGPAERAQRRGAEQRRDRRVGAEEARGRGDGPCRRR